VVAACRIWCLVFKLSVWCGAVGCVSGLQAIKTHLLHLVGILFPHIIDDARSKPHQVYNFAIFVLHGRETWVLIYREKHMRMFE
jgi:hypothetical protein